MESPCSWHSWEWGGEENGGWGQVGERGVICRRLKVAPAENLTCMAAFVVQSLGHSSPSSIPWHFVFFVLLWVYYNGTRGMHVITLNVRKNSTLKEITINK
jgi:hypothetical protein